MLRRVNSLLMPRNPTGERGRDRFVGVARVAPNAAVRGQWTKATAGEVEGSRGRRFSVELENAHRAF